MNVSMASTRGPDKKARASDAGGWFYGLVICVALVIGQPASTLAMSASEGFEAHAYKVIEKQLGIIFPGAAFADCGESEFPAKCEANKADLIKALKVLSKIARLQWGYDNPLKLDDFIRFFETDFLEISFCFREKCNFGIKYTETDSAQAFKIWVSLGRYLSCRYVAYEAFKDARVGTIHRYHEDNYKVDLRARKICLGSDFPEHLLPYINEVHIIHEGGRF